MYQGMGGGYQAGQPMGTNPWQGQYGYGGQPGTAYQQGYGANPVSIINNLNDEYVIFCSFLGSATRPK